MRLDIRPCGKKKVNRDEAMNQATYGNLSGSSSTSSSSLLSSVSSSLLSLL